eukprot:532771-Amphidinium_carterae.1
MEVTCPWLLWLRQAPNPSKSLGARHNTSVACSLKSDAHYSVTTASAAQLKWCLGGETTSAQVLYAACQEAGDTSKATTVSTHLPPRWHTTEALFARFALVSHNC